MLLFIDRNYTYRNHYLQNNHTVHNTTYRLYIARYDQKQSIQNLFYDEPKLINSRFTVVR